MAGRSEVVEFLQNLSAAERTPASSVYRGVNQKDRYASGAKANAKNLRSKKYDVDTVQRMLESGVGNDGSDLSTQDAIERRVARMEAASNMANAINRGEFETAGKFAQQLNDAGGNAEFITDQFSKISPRGREAILTGYKSERERYKNAPVPQPVVYDKGGFPMEEAPATSSTPSPEPAKPAEPAKPEAPVKLDSMLRETDEPQESETSLSGMFSGKQFTPVGGGDEGTPAAFTEKIEPPKPTVDENRMSSLFRKATGTDFDPKSKKDKEYMSKLSSFVQSDPSRLEKSDTKIALDFYRTLK